MSVKSDKIRHDLCNYLTDQGLECIPGNEHYITIKNAFLDYKKVMSATYMDMINGLQAEVNRLRSPKAPKPKPEPKPFVPKSMYDIPPHIKY